MPRPIFKTINQTQTQSILNVNQQQNTKSLQQMDKMKFERLLRQPRSKKYVQAICKLDAGGHVHNQEKINEILNTIKNELPEVMLPDILIGYVAICCLGCPYEVHTLSISGSIIKHYKEGEPLPDGMEKARSIAIRGGYAFIEVYTDCCRAVSSDGTVSVIRT